MLIGIYGSKEMFIKEYKDMLADRILTSGSYQTDKEQAHLELLKRRSFRFQELAAFFFPGAREPTE